MKVELGKPPNYDMIMAHFPAAKSRDVVICYGDKIYVPHSNSTRISAPIMAHEIVHSIRQRAVGVEAWWVAYCADKEFRLHEELLAHIEEYIIAGRELTRNQRRGLLRGIAGKLAAHVYGGMITVHRAKDLIVDGEHAKR